ncbi:MAG: hypothetical protein ACRD2A_15025 [Vicinamibacterales bacterium]
MNTPRCSRLIANGLGVACLSLVAVAGVRAQDLQVLAGTWAVDQTATGASGGRGAGVPGFPLATQLVITVSPAEVVVDSDTGSARSTQTSTFKLDGTTTPIPGPLGWDTKAKAAIQDGKLAVTITRSIDGPNGPVGVNVTDVYSVDGPVLTITRTQARTSQKLVYRRKS